MQKYDSDLITSISVGLKDSQIERLDQLASELKINRNALIRFALLWCLSHPPTDIVKLTEDLKAISGNMYSRGVNLRPSEINLLKELADKVGVSKNKLMNLAVVQFLQQVENKSLDLLDYLEIPAVKNNLKMPKY